MDSFARFDESRRPSQIAFFSKLPDSPCSDTEYAHATQVWTAFECESMADYHDIYLKCYVLLLTYFFVLLSTLVLMLYTTTPLPVSLGTHVSLEFITDIDMYHFIGNSGRGGISMITICFVNCKYI